MRLKIYLLWNYVACLYFFVFHYSAFLASKIIFQNYRLILWLWSFIKFDLWFVYLTYLFSGFINGHPLAFLQVSFEIYFLGFLLLFERLSLVNFVGWWLISLWLAFFPNFQFRYWLQLFFFNCLFYFLVLNFLSRDNKLLRRRPWNRCLVIGIWSFSIYATKRVTWLLNLVH